MMNNTEEVYTAFVSSEPFFITGKDFIACNYGVVYSKINGNHRKIGISGNDKSYFAATLEDEFPSNVAFSKESPKMPLTNVTHVGAELRDLKTALTLDQVVKVLQSKGMQFECT